MVKKFVEGPLLPKPQEVFKTVQHNWSTNISIEGPNQVSHTGYYGNKPLPKEAEGNPAIIVRSGYAKVRAIFILKQNISKEEWQEIAFEAMSRPECAMNGGTGDYGVRASTISRIYKGLKYISEYPFPVLKPVFCLEEMYDSIKFTCGTPGPCQKEREGVAGRPGALCKPGDYISYSVCAGMPCNCSTAREYHNTIKELEKVLPTRHQMMLMQKYDEEENKKKMLKLTNIRELQRQKRSEAAKKGWEKRRRRQKEITEAKQVGGGLHRFIIAGWSPPN